MGYRFDRETGKFLGQEVNGKLYKSGEMAPAWNPIKGNFLKEVTEPEVPESERPEIGKIDESWLHSCPMPRKTLRGVNKDLFPDTRAN